MAHFDCEKALISQEKQAPRDRRAARLEKGPFISEGALFAGL